MWLGAGLLFLLGGLLGWKRPAWTLPVLIVLIPWRVPFFEDFYPAIPFFLGSLLGRGEAIVKMLAEQRFFLIATLLFPIWLVASSVWALQPAFVSGLLLKWLVVVGAAWLAATDESQDPRLLVLGMVVAIVPHALWAFSERMHWIVPLGDPAGLKMRVIDFQDNIRGKALFWHPNRLAEFTEQCGLVLVGAGLAGVLPRMAALGVGAAFAAAWATGSTGGMATIFGGAVVCAGWMRISDKARRDAVPVLLAAGLGALLIGVWAFLSHGGIGSRQIIFDFAQEQIALRPWLGAGAGNWSLLVGGSSLEISRFWFLGHAHSLPLHLWVELGLPGVLLVAFFFLGPVIRAQGAFARVSGPWAGVGTGASFAVLGILAHNLVHYFLRDPVDGLMTGIVLGLVVSVARRAALSPDATVDAIAEASA
jgi:hypothetical protein